LESIYVNDKIGAKVKPESAAAELEPELLDVPESANLLRLKESTIRAWMLNKRLPYVKLGRRVFLRRCDLRDLISNGFVPAKA
jgi:excisionase family DNA binding protein